MYDAVIVGAGPAGTTAAASIAKGRNVLIIEEHDEIGVPAQCAGLISVGTADSLGVGFERYGTADTFNIIFPDGREIRIPFDRPRMTVLNRTELDRKLSEKAADSGAEIRRSVKYLSHSVKDGIAYVETTDGTLETKLLIGADGHSSKVALSLGNNGPREYVRGLEFDIKHKSEEQNKIDVIFGTKVAPGFFAWSIPCGDFTRVGLCTSWDAGLPSDYIAPLINRLGLSDKPVLKKYSGKIPLGGRRITYSDNLMLIGDAAGQIKPISGGGLYPIVKAVPCLRETAEEAFGKNDFSGKVLSRYEKRWKSAIGKEMKNGYRMRKMFIKMNDDDFGGMYRAFDNEKLIRHMGEIDIDNTSSIAKYALVNPTFMRYAVPIGLKVLFR